MMSISKIFHTLGLNSIGFLLIVLSVWAMPQLPNDSYTFRLVYSLCLMAAVIYVEMVWFDKLGFKIFDEEDK